MARFLTSLGIPCGHESIFDWNGLEIALRRLQGQEPKVLSVISQENCHAPEWVDPESIEAESSYMAAPYLDHDVLRKTVIIHLVRHPVKVVNSFCNYHGYFQDPKQYKEDWEGFIYSHLPDLTDPSLTHYDRACLYYVLWNEMIEHKLAFRGFFFHRIENDPSQVADFLDMTMPPTAFNDNSINTLKKACKPFDVRLISSQEIKKRFMDIGERYGYNMKSENLLI